MRKVVLFLFCLLWRSASTNNTDRFNYRKTEGGTDYGPQDWSQVTCGDVGECQGWPDGWELGVGWDLGSKNLCQWCPADGNHNCGLHRQSPIDLLRTAAGTGHDTECYDYHWMAYQDGSCKWHDMVRNGYTNPYNNFRIQRHSLQILTPVDEDGQLQCGSEKRFPRLDYSKGFPDWWFLSHTEITVPSEHTQGGKRYAGEVHLSHFYSVDHERKIGKVAILLETDPNRRRWGFLDKLICQWREVEEQQRQECGLASAPPYPGCRNPARQEQEYIPEVVDPYPFIDCDTIDNYSRICKATSCCEAERSTTHYCVNDVYGLFGDEMVGSICWWCCPGKVLDREDGAPTSPTMSPTVPPVETPSSSRPDTPTPLPSPATVAPAVIPVFQCDDFDGQPGIDLRRICKDDSCCSPDRSATDHCHYVYKFFGDDIDEICSQCCDPPKEIGPPPPPHTVYPPIDCSLVSNPNRMCKPNSCCDEFRSESEYCFETYEEYGNSIGSICWYCCAEPKEADPSLVSIDSGPTGRPSSMPTQRPSDAPVRYPTTSPTGAPTILPSQGPSEQPSQQVSFNPSSPPTLSSRPTASPTRRPSTTPSIHPSGFPTSFPSNTPTKFPSPLPSTSPTSVPSVSLMPTQEPSPQPSDSPVVAEPLQCSDYDGKNGIEIQRICKDDGCCDPVRSSTNQCHQVYKFFGDDMDRVCSDCCNKALAPPPPEHSVYPPIDCTLVSNPFRICKPTSCCNEEKSKTWYCKDTYETYGDAMGSICWYCCSQPKEVDPSVLRRLSSPKDQVEVADRGTMQEESNETERSKENGVLLPQGLWSSDLKMDPSNFEPHEDAEKQHVADIEEFRSRNEEELTTDNSLRKLQSVENGDNYANVRYSPYEWMREVRTEYYFRYEGGQMVPPCYETVHYRVLKDPIRIHPIQLQELERLLAWRIAPKGSGPNECQRDTAGRERPGSNGDAVDLNRPLQEYSNIHRKVFCECNDWDSKWKEDQEWCMLDKRTRFFDRPYNFL